MQPVNNKFYFRAYNDDYKKGGCYFHLDNSELCTYIKLQAYSDGYGYVRNINGSGLPMTTLTDMLSVNYRTLKKVLISLESQGIIGIDIDENNHYLIYITSFIYNHTERDQYAKKDYKQERAIQQSIANKKTQAAVDQELRESINKINKKVDGIKEVVKNGME